MATTKKTEPKKRKRGTNPASSAIGRAVAKLYPTVEARIDVIRKAMAKHRENPEKEIDDIMLYGFGIPRNTRLGWVVKCGLTQEWAQHTVDMVKAKLLPAPKRDPHKYDEDARILLLRRVIVGYREDPDTNTVEKSLLKYGEGITSAKFYEWIMPYPRMVREVNGLAWHHEEYISQGHVIDYRCSGFGCPQEEHIQGFFAALDIYLQPREINGLTSLPDRETAIREAGLTQTQFWNMTKRDGGMVAELWQCAIAKQDRILAELRQDIKPRLRHLIDNAVVNAMQPDTVLHEDTTITRHYDANGNLIGETEQVKERRQRLPDPKLLPFFMKVVGEAPRDEPVQTQSYIIYEQSAHPAQLETVADEAQPVIDELEERKRLRKQGLLGTGTGLPVQDKVEDGPMMV